MTNPLDVLRYHVTGAIERGESQPIVEQCSMDYPRCEVCGEQDATCQTQEVGMCDDCFEDAVRDALTPLLGRTCASVSRNRPGFLQVCLAPYGIEHDHGEDRACNTL